MYCWNAFEDRKKLVKKKDEKKERKKTSSGKKTFCLVFCFFLVCLAFLGFAKEILNRMAFDAKCF
jgi:hypothetical protein